MSFTCFYPVAVFCSVILFHLKVFHAGKEEIKYMNEKTINLPVAGLSKKVINLEEDASVDTLYQYLSESGFPVYYARNIRTSVCFDNQCRLLDIKLFWNPTGRYLGFELPKEEYLSKHDHDPFTEEEYIRLNELLSDPDLPLGNFAYNEIMMASEVPKEEIDGISGATSKDLLEYVVEGAAYTTHKLYKIIYGETRELIADWTKSCSDEEFIGLIINSRNYRDKIWGLELVKGRLWMYPEIKRLIWELAGSDDYSLSEKAVNTLSPRDLEDEKSQLELMAYFSKFDYGRRNWLIQLLKNTRTVFPSTVRLLNGQLLAMEIPLVVEILEIYKKKGIRDEETLKAVTELSASENQYLATKASAYLNMS
jgi:hypothetical protein